MNLTLGRPLAATLLLGGLVAIALFAAAASWADLSSALEERDAKSDLLVQGAAASRRARTVAPGEAAANPFIVADSETLAAGRLDAIVRTTSVEEGCSLLSSRAEVKPDEDGIGGRIQAQAVIEGQNEALQATLAKWETGAPMIVVDNLSIELAEPMPGTATDPQAPRLRMSVTLSAFWKAVRS